MDRVLCPSSYESRHCYCLWFGLQLVRYLEKNLLPVRLWGGTEVSEFCPSHTSSLGGHLCAVSDKRDSAAAMCFTTTQHYFPRVLRSAASTLPARARRRMAKLRVLQDRWRSRGYVPIICYHVVAVSAIMTLRDCELHPLIRSFLMTFLLKRCLANVSL